MDLSLRMGVGLLALMLAPGPAEAQRPSAAKVAPVQETYHGETVVDPYRWMEARGEDFVTWAKDQDDHARAVLGATPSRAQIAQRVAAFSAANVAAARAELAGTKVFYLKRPPGGAQAALFVRGLAGGPERRLIDPEQLAASGRPVAIQAFTPSPDSRYVAYSLSEGGSEEAVLRVLVTSSGETLSEVIDRARFADPAWDPERPEFYYSRLSALAAGVDKAGRFKNQSVWRHRVGEDPARDQMVFTVSEQATAMGDDGIPDLLIPAGSRWAIARINTGVSSTGEYYAADLAALRAGKPQWRRIAGVDDLILQVSANTALSMPPAVIGSSLYVGSNKDAPRGKIVRLDLAHPSAPVTVVPEQAGVLTGFAPAADGAYATYAIGGRYGISLVDLRTGRLSKVATPYPGAIYEVATDPTRAGAVFSLESWARPKQMFAAQPGGRVTDLGLSAPFPHDLSQVVVDEITITARDGTQVPVSIVRRADNKRQGAAPAIVEAYGAYGISVDPYFDPRWIPWVLDGGVYVTVHARGGGEFGEAWWKAGFQATKPNTWRDVIDAVTAIGTMGYAAPDRIVGLGTSAGGIAVGRAVTERPDLFAGAILNVPISDTLRFELTEGGPSNVAEFGTVKTLEGFKALQGMSPYEHVVAGAKYPAMLVTAGMNDHRVPPWQPAKLAARFQAATASGKPVLFRVEWNAGHGIGSSKAQRDEQYADFYAFARLATGEDAANSQ